MNQYIFAAVFVVGVVIIAFVGIWEWKKQREYFQQKNKHLDGVINSLRDYGEYPDWMDL